MDTAVLYEVPNLIVGKGSTVRRERREFESGLAYNRLSLSLSCHNNSNKNSTIHYYHTKLSVSSQMTRMIIMYFVVCWCCVFVKKKPSRFKFIILYNIIYIFPRSRFPKKKHQDRKNNSSSSGGRGGGIVSKSSLCSSIKRRKKVYLFIIV